MVNPGDLSYQQGNSCQIVLNVFLEFYFQLMSFILITSSLSIYWQIAVKCFLLLQDVRIFILSLFLDQLSP